VNDHVRISQAKKAGFGWIERVLGGLLVVLTLLLVLAVGLMILSVLVAGGIVLAGWVWWWRRRLLQSAIKKPLVIEGECRVLDLGHAAGDSGSKDGSWNWYVRRRFKR
jgi:Flp pilus assembly protein TadB